MTCERCGQETSGGGREHVNVYQCVTNLQTTCGRLRAVLRFYADPKIYQDRTPYEGDSDAWADGGLRARAALGDYSA